MKVLPILIFTFLSVAISAQRIDISSQIEKAPTGDKHVVTTDAATGKQQYEKVTDVLVGGGTGDVVQDVTYDGDNLTVETDQNNFPVTINSGSLKTVTAVTIDGTIYPVGTDIQTVISQIILSQIQLHGIYKSHQDAENNGCPLNGYFETSGSNTMGTGSGDIIKRK